jgi:hypothetical protein
VNLSDPDSDKFEELADYIKKPFRAFSLKECFSLMVVPGFLEDIPISIDWQKLGEKKQGAYHYRFAEFRIVQGSPGTIEWPGS